MPFNSQMWLCYYKFENIHAVRDIKSGLKIFRSDSQQHRTRAVDFLFFPLCILCALIEVPRSFHINMWLKQKRLFFWRHLSILCLFSNVMHSNRKILLSSLTLTFFLLQAASRQGSGDKGPSCMTHLFMKRWWLSATNLSKPMIKEGAG